MILPPPGAVGHSPTTASSTLLVQSFSQEARGSIREGGTGHIQKHQTLNVSPCVARQHWLRRPASPLRCRTHITKRGESFDASACSDTPTSISYTHLEIERGLFDVTAVRSIPAARPLHRAWSTLGPVAPGVDGVPVPDQPAADQAQKGRRAVRRIQHHGVGRTHHRYRSPALHGQRPDL